MFAVNWGLVATARNLVARNYVHIAMCLRVLRDALDGKREGYG